MVEAFLHRTRARPKIPRHTGSGDRRSAAGFRRRASQHRSGRRGSAAPRRPDGVPLVRMRAFEGHLKQMLPGVLTDTVLCQSIFVLLAFPTISRAGRTV